MRLSWLVTAVAGLLSGTGCVTQLSDMEKCELIQIDGELLIPEDGPPSCAIVAELIAP